MVGLHVVDNEVVDGSVTQYFSQILKELTEEVYFHGVDKAHLLIVYQI